MKKLTIKRITIGIFITLIIVSSVSVIAKAYEELPDACFSYHYYDYGNDELMVSWFQRKQTTKDMFAYCDNATHVFGIRAIATNDGEGDICSPHRAYTDVSEGNSYYMSTGSRASLWNRVIEWGYTYGGILGVCYGDDDFEANGFFNAD